MNSGAAVETFSSPARAQVLKLDRSSGSRAAISVPAARMYSKVLAGPAFITAPASVPPAPRLSITAARLSAPSSTMRRLMPSSPVGMEKTANSSRRSPAEASRRERSVGSHSGLAARQGARSARNFMPAGETPRSSCTRLISTSR